MCGQGLYFDDFVCEELDSQTYAMASVLVPMGLRRWGTKRHLIEACADGSCISVI